MEPDKQIQALTSAGYLPVRLHSRFHLGQRVRHIGEQYSDALHNGTGVIEKIYVRDRDGSIEMIIKRDNPRTGLGSAYGYWADYHTVTIEKE